MSSNMAFDMALDSSGPVSFNMAFHMPLDTPSPQSFVTSAQHVEFNDGSSSFTKVTAYEYPEPPSPVFSAQEISSNDKMDLDSDSELKPCMNVDHVTSSTPFLRGNIFDDAEPVSGPVESYFPVPAAPVKSRKRTSRNPDAPPRKRKSLHSGSVITSLNGTTPLDPCSDPTINLDLKLYWKSEQEGYPAPYGQPLAWATTRQALCETLPYYRAYQSGPYTNQGRAYGLLIDKEGSSRDIFNEEVIITRVGGGKQWDKEAGKMIQTSDRDMSAARLSFERSRAAKQPIGVIAGQGKKTSPCKMPHYYNVLAWFHVTDVWTERNATGKMDAMVRLEKIDLYEKSWWAASGTPLPDPNRDMDAFTATHESCGTCGTTSQVIFQQGWTCLHTACRRFFEFDAPEGLSASNFYETLTYSRDLVEKRTRFEGLVEDLLVPSLPTADKIGTDLFGCEIQFGKGVVCPICCACSRRIHWEKWSCENKDCEWFLSATRSIASVAEVVGDFVPNITKVDPSIIPWDMALGSYDVTEYILPGEEPGTQAGFVRHFKANDTINAQPRGPDELFCEMQSENFHLQRKTVRTPGSPGEILTKHYLMNWGAPYKFIAPVDSKPFSEAPDQILTALKRMTWAGKQAVTANHGHFMPFNELLSLGYLEGGAMGYHDDGEKTLGPTVCSLSLGASSTMTWRPKKKSNIGIGSGQAKLKSSVLTITLNHGDMMVMDGADIQKSYEHSVKPLGKLRFVFTGRYIEPEQIIDPIARERAISDGALPHDITQYTYDGDANPIPLSVFETAERDCKAEADFMARLEARILSNKLSEQGVTKLLELLGLSLRNTIVAMPHDAVQQPVSGSCSSNTVGESPSPSQT